MIGVQRGDNGGDGGMETRLRSALHPPDVCAEQPLRVHVKMQRACASVLLLLPLESDCMLNLPCACERACDAADSDVVEGCC